MADGFIKQRAKKNNPQSVAPAPQATATPTPAPTQTAPKTSPIKPDYVNFDTPGQVKYSEGGVDKVATTKDYNALQALKAGAGSKTYANVQAQITPQINEGLVANKLLQNQINPNATDQGINSGIQYNAVNQDFQKQLANQQQVNIPSMDQLNAQVAQDNPNTTGAIAQTDFTKGQSGVGNIAPTAGRLFLASVGGIAREVYSGLDALRSLSTIGGKDTADVQGARATFSQAISAFETDNKLVADGQLPASQALENLKRATLANLRLKRAVSGYNVQHLRYFLKGGADLQTDIALFDEQLAIQRTALEQAIAQNQINSANMNLGK